MKGSSLCTCDTNEAYNCIRANIDTRRIPSGFDSLDSPEEMTREAVFFLIPLQNVKRCTRQCQTFTEDSLQPIQTNWCTKNPRGKASTRVDISSSLDGEFRKLCNRWNHENKTMICPYANRLRRKSKEFSFHFLQRQTSLTRSKGDF